ncbi:penicillin-binding transpeptidase domain-containing protein [Bacillus sp. JCM 19041]|uniref:penicillin-binding transpeptidase domain-containing protein n=1 Tax=Bacillus sp. JCM 19041 TaxID=1460637 RepID=UPI0006CFDBE2
MQPDTTQVMEDYTGYMITDMLKTAVNSGTGQRAQVPGVDIAGKTGTGNFDGSVLERMNSSSGYPTSAFTGYSTQYTASVWIGFSNHSEPDNYLTDTHGGIAQQIFQHIMTDLHSGIDTPDFTKPDSVEEVRVERRTGLLPSAGTPQSEIVTELFVRGTGPSNVSEEYAEISDPTNVTYTYDEEDESIEFSWSYPSDEVDDVEFETSINTGSLNVDEDNMTATLSNVSPGNSYTFSVQAVATDGSGMESASVSVTANIEEAVEEEEEEPEEEEEATPPEEEEEEEDPANDDSDSGSDSGDDSGGDEQNGDNSNGDSNNGENGNDNGGDTEPDNGDDPPSETPTPDEEPEEEDSEESSTQSNDDDE